MFVVSQKHYVEGRSVGWGMHVWASIASRDWTHAWAEEIKQAAEFLLSHLV